VLVQKGYHIIAMAQPQTAPSVLVVMAHPDDGEFMCGATIARWAREGRRIDYCILTNGDCGTRDPAIATRTQLATLRQREAQAAAEALGLTSQVIFLNYVDSELLPTLELRRDVTRVIRQVRPDMVVTQDPSTFYHAQGYINHPDHRCVGEVTLAAIMPSASMRLIFPELYEVEGLEPFDVSELFLTNTTHTDRWVEVTEEDLGRQAAALRAHASQIQSDPAEWVMAEARAEAERARACGHDFAYAEGFKYFRLR
jgi:LmbE family N-acetylglucosaminyl deacetylase